ncbi:MAG: DMT family transporter [Acidimicrobiia bacterium]|nr:DMT family transporter [Acidimicrobiia bacterium]
MWGAASVLAKAADHVDGLTLAFHRLWVGAVAMLVIFTVRGGRLRWRLLVAALPAGIAFAADIGLFFTAVKHTTVANATMISALQPALLLFVAGPLFGERVHVSDVWWTVVALVGVSVVVFGSSTTPSWSPFGDIMAVLCLFAWTAYFIFGKQGRAKLDAVEFVTAMSLVAFVVIALVAVGTGHDLTVPDGGTWAVILTLGLGTGGMGHFLINWAHGHAPLVLTSMLTLLIPVVAMASAAVFLGEDVVAAQIAGAVIVLGALGVLVWRRQPQEPDLPLEVAEQPL